MTDKIPPALTVDEWGREDVKETLSLPSIELARQQDSTSLFLHECQADGRAMIQVHAEQLPALVALANAALPDSDMRKITRNSIMELRAIAEQCQGEWGAGEVADEAAFLNGLADALESYLPPETT